MKTNTNITSTIAAMLLAAPIAVGTFTAKVAYAQSYSQSINTTRQGTGRLTVAGGRDDELREVRVELRRGGDARVTLRGRDTHTFDGTWSERRGGGDISLRLTGRENGDSARLSGTITMGRRGQDVDSLRLNGYAGRNRLDVNFEASGRGQGGGWGGGNGGGNSGGWGGGNGGSADKVRSLDSTQDGRGNFDAGRRRSQSLTKARVNLDSNGHAEVVLYWNGDRETFTGRWFQPGNSDDVRLTLNGSLDGRDVQVSGTVNLRTKDKGRFDRFTLNGGGVNASFEAK